MDWFKESQTMMQAWTESQKKLWDNWVDTFDVNAKQMKTTEVWEKALETWEETVNSSLDMQTQWAHFWAENISSQKMIIPAEMTEWAKQTEAMTERWSETQRELWQSWFKLIKKADAAKMAEAWGEEGQKAFQTWQESTQEIMTAQMEWAKQWKPETANSKK